MEEGGKEGGREGGREGGKKGTFFRLTDLCRRGGSWIVQY